MKKNVLKYIQNDIKDKYLVSLHNKNSRDSSLHYIAFFFHLGDSMGFLRDSLLLQIDIKGYPSFGVIKASGSDIIDTTRKTHC